MKRIVLLALAVALVIVAYAAAGESAIWGRVLGLFESSQRLPSLRTAETPFRYPATMWRQGVEGEVLLRIHITATGEVDSVTLHRSSGHSVLDSIALNGAHELHYHPARQGDKPVAVWATLPIVFQRSRESGEGVE